MTHAGSTTFDTVKTNPIPAALVAVGLGWLIVSGMKSKKASTYDSRIGARSFDGIDEDGYAYSYDQGVARENLASSSYGEESVGRPRRVINRGRRAVSNVGHEAFDKASSVASSVQGRVSDAASTVADKAEHLAHDASTIAHDAGERVGMAASQASRRVGMVARNAGAKGRRVVRRAGAQARRAEQGFERELRQNPLAFGAVAVAVGAAIGLLLPRTDAEDRLLGEKKDMLLDQARERLQGAAQQAMSTVQDKAQGLSQTAGAVAKGAGSIADKIGGDAQTSGLSQSNGLSNGVSKHA